MGLFSSSYKYFAYAASGALFPLDDRPNTVESLLLQAAISQQASLSEAITLGLQTNLYARSKAMVRYATKEGGYVRELPTSSTDTIIVLDRDIRSAINRSTGNYPGDFVYKSIGEADDTFLVKMWLKENYTNDAFFGWIAAGGLPLNTVWDESRETVEIPVVDPDTGLYYLADNTDIQIVRVFIPDPDPLDPQPNQGYWNHRITFNYIDNLGAPSTYTIPLDIDFTEYLTGTIVQIAYQNQSINNPSFEQGNTGWVNSIAAVHPTASMEIVENEHFEDGTWSAKLTCPAGTSARLMSTTGHPVTPGDFVNAEARVMHQSSTGRSQGRVEYYDALGVFISSFGGGDWGVDMNGAILDTWMISKWQGIAPANATEVRIGSSLYNPAGSPTDAVAFFDSFEWDLTIDSQTYYWIYVVDSGLDTIFEAAIDVSSNQGLYLPVIIMMRDKIWFDEPLGTDIEITTEKLLKRLTMDGQEIKEDYLDQKAEDEASGDDSRQGAEEWDFFIHFATPVHSNIEGTKEYIFHWLRELDTTESYTRADYDDYLANPVHHDWQPFSTLHITEGDSAGDIGGYNVEYRWSYIEEQRFEGEFVDEDGDTLRVRRTHAIHYERSDTNHVAYKVGLEEMHGPGVALGTFNDDDALGYHDYVIFTRQFRDPSTHEYYYIRVLCMALSMKYIINTADPLIDNEYRLRDAIVEMFPEIPADFDPETDSDPKLEFRIPIKINLLKEVATMHREELLADALAATVFLVQEQKVKWYQSGFWKWLIIIIAIIVIVLSYRYDLLSGVANFASLTGLSGLALYTVYYVMAFAIGFIISFAGSLIGGELGTLFTIVGTMVAMSVNPFTNVTQTFKTFVDSPSFGSAVSFIQATDVFIRSGMRIYARHEFRQLQHEMDDWLKTHRERQQELQDAWDDLGTITNVDPFDLIRAQSDNMAETPETFYNRTLNMNPGLLGYDLIFNFSEIALVLPEVLNDTNIIESEFEILKQQRGA